MERPARVFPEEWERLGRCQKACLSDTWHIRLIEKETGEETLTPFRCKSWRCSRCRKTVFNLDSIRVASAINDRSGTPPVYMVSTVDPARWPKGSAAWDHLLPVGQDLVRKIRTEWGPTEYVAVVEVQANGRPHTNWLLWGDVASESYLHDFRRVRPRLVEMNVKAGYGRIMWVEPMRSADRLAGYLAKVGTSPNSRIAGELTKPGQLPIESPSGFRRLRSSRGTLGPRVTSDGRYTGEFRAWPRTEAEAMERWEERRMP